MWIARNENGTLYAFDSKPIKSKRLKGYWTYDTGPNYQLDDRYAINLPKKCFPEIKWSDEEPRELILKPIKELEHDKRTN